ncbi:uncharacterized protein [Hemitrygon akajei]|uniref:uncharacterized protein n=1 Tax=Hemitrygon akajei TaxID=2704970 RepID=UPI003BFA089F
MRTTWGRPDRRRWWPGDVKGVRAVRRWCPGCADSQDSGTGVETRPNLTTDKLLKGGDGDCGVRVSCVSPVRRLAFGRPQELARHGKRMCKGGGVRKERSGSLPYSPFTYLVCGKSFTYLSKLQTHRLVHSDERPFRCPDCGKGFKCSANLKGHCQAHTDERPFACADCGKTFKSSGDLTTHQRAHTGCAVCGKGFTHSSTLLTHQLVHTDERPVRCSECGKAFKSFQELRRHQRQHTGERPCTCPVRGKCFAHSSNLQKHHRVYSGE